MTPFSVYTYPGRCVTHEIVPNIPIVWRSCEENDDINNGLIKRTTYGNNKHLTNMSCYIIDFHNGTLSTNVK